MSTTEKVRSEDTLDCSLLVSVNDFTMSRSNFGNKKYHYVIFQDKPTMAILVHFVYNNGEKPIIMKNDNMIVIIEGHIKDNIVQGYVHIYNSDGILCEEGKYENNKRNGIIKKYDKFTQKLQLIKYLNNKPISKLEQLQRHPSYWKEIDLKTNSILTLAEYSNDTFVLNGKCFTFYNDTVSQLILYKNGQLQHIMRKYQFSLCEEYDIKGNTIFIGTYQNEMNALYCKYKYGCTYVNNQPKEIHYYENDISQYRYKSFSNDLMTEYTKSGKIIYIGNYNADILKCYPRNGYGCEYDNKILICYNEYNDDIVIKTLYRFKYNTIAYEYYDNRVIYKGQYCLHHNHIYRHGLGTVYENSCQYKARFNMNKEVYRLQYIDSSQLLTNYNRFGFITYIGSFKEEYDDQWLPHGKGTCYLLNRPHYKGTFNMGHLDKNKPYKRIDYFTTNEHLSIETLTCCICLLLLSLSYSILSFYSPLYSLFIILTYFILAWYMLIRVHSLINIHWRFYAIFTVLFICTSTNLLFLLHHFTSSIQFIILCALLCLHLIVTTGYCIYIYQRLSWRQQVASYYAIRAIFICIIFILALISLLLTVMNSVVLPLVYGLWLILYCCEFLYIVISHEEPTKKYYAMDSIFIVILIISSLCNIYITMEQCPLIVFCIISLLSILFIIVQWFVMSVNETV